MTTMPKNRFDLYGGADPRDLPAYTIREAAHYLRIPPSTLSSWVRGRSYPIANGQGFFDPVIQLTLRKRPLLSFTNLIEAHVLAAVRRQHNVPLPHVRTAIGHVRERLGVERPLAHVDFETDGVDLFVVEMGQLINVSNAGQIAMRDVLHAHLRRVERDDHGLAQRLFPFTRPDDLNAPRVVVIDSRISFGRAVVEGTGVPITVLAERYLAGDSAAQLAKDYQLDPGVIDEAIRCELRAAA